MAGINVMCLEGLCGLAAVGEPYSDGYMSGSVYKASEEIPISHPDLPEMSGRAAVRAFLVDGQVEPELLIQTSFRWEDPHPAIGGLQWGSHSRLRLKKVEARKLDGLTAYEDDITVLEARQPDAFVEIKTKRKELKHLQSWEPPEALWWQTGPMNALWTSDLALGQELLARRSQIITSIQVDRPHLRILSPADYRLMEPTMVPAAYAYLASTWVYNMLVRNGEPHG